MVNLANCTLSFKLCNAFTFTDPLSLLLASQNLPIHSLNCLPHSHFGRVCGILYIISTAFHLIEQVNCSSIVGSSDSCSCISSSNSNLSGSMFLRFFIM